jgi:hypothetical protein
MRQGKRFGLSAIEKSDLWRRWKAGQSLHEIGRAFDKPHSCVTSPESSARQVHDQDHRGDSNYAQHDS